MDQAIGKVGKTYVLPSSVKPTKEQIKQVAKVKKDLRENKTAPKKKVLTKKQKAVAKENKEIMKAAKKLNEVRQKAIKTGMGSSNWGEYISTI